MTADESRIRARRSPIWWFSVFARILNKDKELIRPKPNIFQIRMAMAEEWCRKMGIIALIIGCKPRQVGQQPDASNNEQASNSGDRYNQVVKMAEIYLRSDPDGSGHQKEVMLVMALEKRIMFYGNYTRNVTAPGVNRPFRVERITPKRGRWWGISEYKLNKHKQLFIDWCLNEVVYKNSTEGVFRIADRDAVEGWDTEEPQPGPKTHFRKKGSNTDPAQAITYILPPPIEEGLLDLAKDMMQSAQAERGNLSPGGDSMSQLPSSKLKYGIQAIKESGDEIYSLSAMHAGRGLTEIVHAMVLTMLANMDAVEEFEVADGDDYLVCHINRSDVDNLDMNVTLEMTLTRGDQIAEQNALAMEIVLQYCALAPCDQARVYQFVIARLKAMDIQDVEKHVLPPSDEDVAVSQQARRMQQEAMAQPVASAPAAGKTPPAEPAPSAFVSAAIPSRPKRIGKSPRRRWTSSALGWLPRKRKPPPRMPWALLPKRRLNRPLPRKPNFKRWRKLWQRRKKSAIPPLQGWTAPKPSLSARKFGVFKPGSKKRKRQRLSPK